MIYYIAILKNKQEPEYLGIKGKNFYFQVFITKLKGEAWIFLSKSGAIEAINYVCSSSKVKYQREDFEVVKWDAINEIQNIL